MLLDILSFGHATNVILLIISIVLLLVGAIFIGIGWIGALIKTARLARWGWFVCLLLFGPFTMFGYVFVGPTTPIAQLQQTSYKVKEKDTPLFGVYLRRAFSLSL